MKKIIIILLLTTSLLSAKRLNKESVYQKVFADYIQGQTEYKLLDKSRVDIITKEHAIEVDFANKFYESVSQALYYALMTDKNPGIVIIVEDVKKDQKYISKLLYIVDNLNSKGYNFSVWVIDKEFKINRIKG